MFFLFGTRRKATTLGQVERGCPKCSRVTVHMAIESKRWFTLFFIPVIPLGSNYAVRCGVCGLATKGTPELKNQLMARSAAASA